MADLLSFPRSPRSDRPRPSDPEPLWRHLLGDQLRRRRHDREETLTETAEKAGVSPQYLSEVERGLKEPSSEMIAAIAGALDTSLIELTSAVADELRSVSASAAVSMSAGPGMFALAA
ncbi:MULTISPECIES: helix-turn-helix domain-containing protein [unclassified Microbacterium]|uniref:helix-turn-helix domain-containing protein n=1 Tax=unclassified Microbacterium TaxID=2609290 RepID=UPI000CFC8130|nr:MULTISPECIES: helix-turn-helix transcriptional regulator [unclassified Microbacterium]PQZ60156.1 transcriptional regulator [Microbacterium sp. MYb43]PQZ79498.1 transcriptional regulator [Microbacterium sp. MYb40]PRB23199.1 transcriptional regulator [Microbacterium sp. MYb54]PRB27524.1 transcriptional regulator [Microbacterium sp. MYb50]PRB65815.1 transcriptional regulator [Microbacterium sp. MYb24]